jgi:hypothetical protein
MLRYSLRWAAAAMAAQVAVVVLSPYTVISQVRLAQTSLAEAHWAALACFLLCLYRQRFLAGRARARRIAACAALVLWSLQGITVVLGFLGIVGFATSRPAALILLQYVTWVAFLTVFVKEQVETGSPLVRWLAAALGAITAVRGLLLLYGEATKEIRDWPIAGWYHPTFDTFWYYALSPVVFALGWIPLAAFLFASWRHVEQPAAVD